MKKITAVVFLFFSFLNTAYAEYIIESTIDENKELVSLIELDKFVDTYGVNTRIGNPNVYIGDKFIGKNPYPVHVAVILNDNKKLQKYISMGANVNVELEYPGMTPLILAVKNNNLEAVKMLLEAGANVNYNTIRFNLSAVDFASNYEIADLLVSKGAEVDKINSYDYMTPLHKAILARDVRLTALFLPKSNIYQKDFIFYKDAMDYAVAKRDMSIINMLILQGYKLSTQEYENFKLSIKNDNIIKILGKAVDKNKKTETINIERYKAEKEILKDRIYNSDIVVKYPEIKEKPYEYIYLYNKYKTKETPAYVDLAKMYKYKNFENMVKKNKNIKSVPKAKVFYEDIFTSSVALNNKFLVKSILYAGYNDTIKRDEFYKKGITNGAGIAIYNSNVSMLKLLVRTNYVLDECNPPVYAPLNSFLRYSCYDLITDMLEEPYISGDNQRSKYVYPNVDDSETVMVYDKINNIMILKSKAELYNFKRIVDDYSDEFYSLARKNSNNFFISDKADWLSDKIRAGMDMLDRGEKHALRNIKDETYKDALNTLLNMGVNMYIGDNESSVFKFVENPELLEVFIRHKVNVNVRSINNKPLLFYAVKSKSLESVKLLVENGANLDDLFRGTSILEYSKMYGTKAITSYLKSKISDKGIKFEDDELMKYFKSNKNDKAVKIIMNLYDNNTLNTMYTSNNQEIKPILENADKTKGFSGNILCLAGISEHYKLVSLLVERGADINVLCKSDGYLTIDPTAYLLADGNTALYDKYINNMTIKESKYLSALVGARISLDSKKDFVAGKNKVLEYLFKKKIFTEDDKILVLLFRHNKYFEEIFKYINIKNYDNWAKHNKNKFNTKKVKVANPLKASIMDLDVEQVKILLKHGAIVKGKEDLLAYAKSYKANTSNKKDEKKRQEIIKLLEEYSKKKK